MKRMALYIPVSKRSLVFFLLLGLVFSLSNCEKNTATPAPIVLPATVSYSNDIQPIFSLYCALSGCHTGSDPARGLDLSAGYSYSALFNAKGGRGHYIDTLNPANSGLYTALSSPMPPWGELVPYDVDLILKWIQQGAKNN